MCNSQCNLVIFDQLKNLLKKTVMHKVRKVYGDCIDNSFAFTMTNENGFIFKLSGLNCQRFYRDKKNVSVTIFLFNVSRTVFYSFIFKSHEQFAARLKAAKHNILFSWQLV